MNYLIIGGSKSGKSKIGEKISLSLNKDKIIYVATMKPYDEEDVNRIKAHIKDRQGYNFTTIEKQKNLKDIIYEIDESDTVLIDSVTSLLTNEMFAKDEIVTNVSNKICYGLKCIIEKAENVIIVSDYIFNDAIEYDEITQQYKKQLGLINREMAKICDNVIECSFGNINKFKVYSGELKVNEKIL